MNTTAAGLLQRFIEHHVETGARLPVADLCASQPDLAPALERLVQEYLRVSGLLDAGRDLAVRPDPDPDATRAAPWLPDTAPGLAAAADGPLPVFAGFQTIERIGAGGMGEVYKLRDLQLNRLVAAKVVRRGSPAAVRYGDFLSEARSLALFSDRRVVQIHEARLDADPPVIIMEHVDGFELGRIARSLEFPQRARLIREVCEAVHHAHTLGIQHRDLKPSNIMVDAALQPKILDFGLASGDPSRGHFVGTPAYLAPEQLDPRAALDARVDVYALGVVLYELLCGVPPYAAGDTAALLDAIRRGRPRLPAEINTSAPEPLQAVALKAMETDPVLRYASALDMALDLGRYLDGLPVTARPSLYATALEARIRPHLDHVQEWQRLKLIHPHEASTLRGAYRRLESREEDWILESRDLSHSQIALYLGAFLLLAGGLFYFIAFETGSGWARPLAALALPFAGLHAAADWLYRREWKAVAVAFYLAALSLLPVALVLLLGEAGVWPPDENDPDQLLAGYGISNRQMQVTLLATFGWCYWLALRTRTAGLSTSAAVAILLLALAVLADLGLRAWLEDERPDLLAIHLAPLVLVYGLVGMAGERRARPWLARPWYLAAVALFVIVLELLALDGRELGYLGVTMRPLQMDVSNPLLLDTLGGMTLNGFAIYVAADLLDRRGSALMKVGASVLFMVSPFAIIQPIGWISKTGEYSLHFDWFYLAAAVIIAVLSHARQRRAFFYAGVLNTGVALYLIADHRDWLDRPAYGMAVVLAGLAALGLGYALNRRERRR
jgi:serine/threonine protein kinase